MTSREGSSNNNTSQSTHRPGTGEQDNPNKKHVEFTHETPTRSSSEFVTPGETFPEGNPFFANPDSPPGPSSAASSRPGSGVFSDEQLSAQIHAAMGQPYQPKPKPAIRHREPPRVVVQDDDEDGDDDRKRLSKIRAQEAAQELAKNVQSFSEPGSKRNSAELSDDIEAGPGAPARRKRKFNGFIPLGDLAGVSDVSDEDHLDGRSRTPDDPKKEANQIVNQFLEGDSGDLTYRGAHSAAPTPSEEKEAFLETGGYVPRPEVYRGGVLGALLKYNQSESHSRESVSTAVTSEPSSAGNSPDHSPARSGPSTPSWSTPVLKPWHHRRVSSGTSVSELIKASSNFAAPAGELGRDVAVHLRKTKPRISKKNSRKYKIKRHIEDIRNRQRYLLLLCRALISYGAPTHRLEQYLAMSARVLEIEASFLYLPSCMIVSFEDSSIGASEVKMIKTPQGIDLGRLKDTHEIYKDVVHDRIGVGAATDRLKEVMARKPKYPRWFIIFMYGIASAAVGPWSFEARLIDMPLCCALGWIVGFLQLKAAARSELFLNVFEVVAAIISSFLARLLGSLKGGQLFCFSALTQASLAMILPGYLVLCSSLELQSKNIVSGSIRMVYAIVYSFFLGYGITIGSTLYGLMDKNASSASHCTNPLSDQKWGPFSKVAFACVPIFTGCLIIINKAKWQQFPWMMVVSICGWLVSAAISAYLPSNAQISSTFGAFTIGALANLESRLGPRLLNKFLDVRDKYSGKGWRHLPMSDKQSSKARKVGYGLAAAAMLPAIFCQVPGGIAVSGSLVSSIQVADQITKNMTSGGSTGALATEASSINSVSFTVAYSVVQVAIGITVGLFLSALVVYPYGKKRSGLFSL